ncbi:MAG TPA: hypothetical protein VFU46_03655 [Gemmatimonadales bacterium]|nr:hypothetical protein [Gemmatimonadales bacterium]
MCRYVSPRRAPWSSAATALAALLICSSARPLGLAAQEPDSSAVSADSLAERLRRAEEAIELLRRQLASQAESEVRTASRVQLEVFGRVLLNSYHNSGRANLVDNPQFVLPDGSSPLEPGSFGVAIRQTLAGGAVSVSDVAGGTLMGDLVIDLFGAAQSNPSRSFPQLRLRTARAILAWDRAEILAGQENPLFMGLNPVGLAAVGTPAFVGAGNLWLWLPQLRLSGDVGDRIRLGLQAAVLAPASGEPAGAADPDPADLAERTGRPFLEGRLRLRWGEHETAGEIGVAGHLGWYAAQGTGVPIGPEYEHLRSEGISVDARVPLTRQVELRGEVYRGKLLRGLGGGAIGQNFGMADAAGERRIILDTGGWAQLVVRPHTLWEIGAGVGIDDPDDDDRPLRRRNTAWAAHVAVRPAGPIVAALEYRRMETTYDAGEFANDHLNLALGFEF